MRPNYDEFQRETKRRIKINKGNKSYLLENDSDSPSLSVWLHCLLAIFISTAAVIVTCSVSHTHTHAHEPNCLFCFVVQGRQERERNEKKEEDLDDYSKRGGLDASFKRSVSPNMSLSIYGQSPIFCSFSPWLFFFFLLLYRLLLMVFTRVSILLRNGLGEPVIHLTILPPHHIPTHGEL